MAEQPVTRESSGPQTGSSIAPDEPRKAAEGYDRLATPAEKALIKRIQSRLDYGNRPASRWALERQMFENIAFCTGIQWIEYSEQTRRVAKWNAPAWFPTPVDNQVAPRVKAMHARLLRAKPTGRVRPNKNDATHREGARVGDQIAAHIDDVIHEDELRDWMALVAVLTGTVIAYDGWNPQLGSLLRIPQMQLKVTQATETVATCPTCQGTHPGELADTPCPTCTASQQAAEQLGAPPAPPPTLVAQQRPKFLADGRPAEEIQDQPVLGDDGQPLVDTVREGDLEGSVKTLFNFYWDPKATTLERARWCGEINYVDLDWIDETYPEAGPFVANEEGVDQTSFYEASLLALVGPSIQGTAHYGGAQMFKNGAVLRRYQERPSKQYPKGIDAVVANGVLLYPRPHLKDGGVAENPDDWVLDLSLPIKDQNDQPTGDFSYTAFRFDEIWGRFPGRTPVDDFIPLQRKVNGIDAQIILNRKTLLNPWLLAPKGSGLVPGAVAMRPGATVVYNYVGIGVSPQVVKGEALPQSIYEERKAALEAMDYQAGDERKALKDMPQGTKSGIAMHFLKEQGDETASPQLARWARFQAARKRKQLLLAQRHYREPRAIKLLGAGEQWLVKHWSGADLAGNVDFTIDPGTITPRSPSVRTQLIFDAAEAGLIDFSNPQQRQIALEMLMLREFETEIGPDTRRAEKENAEMDDGNPVNINDEDNDELHLQKHIPRMKDPAFDYLAPAAQQAHRRHTAAHMDRLMKKKAQAEMAQHQLGQQGMLPPPAAAANGKGLADAAAGGAPA